MRADAEGGELWSIDREIRRLTGERSTSRPFLCDGSPIGCDVALVGLNPATTTPFWPHWSARSGCDRAGWMSNYRTLHRGKRTPTRDRIESLVARLDPLRVIELNLYPFASRNERELRAEDRDTRLLEYMLDTVKPPILIVHGQKAVAHLSTFLRASLQLDALTRCERQGWILSVYALHRHLAYVKGGKEYLVGVATIVRNEVTRARSMAESLARDCLPTLTPHPRA
jgi:hypothetical protein